MGDETQIGASRLIAKLGHNDVVEYAERISEDRDEHIVARLDGTFVYSDVLDIREVGWFVGGVSSSGVMFLVKE